MGSSLEEFATKDRPESKAWVMTLPEDIRKEIDGGFDKGISVKTIVRWLKSEKGLSEATDDKIRNYKNNHWIPGSIGGAIQEYVKGWGPEGEPFVEG